ncbi:RNA-directed DNA polymerase, eukaryota, reverse transcriptase zinc-binding domain protein [Tanacetum coccineum]
MYPKTYFYPLLAAKKKLSTQDMMLKWYPSRVFECSLCKKEADSHDHLFFKCEYALKFWRKMCDIASMKIKEDTWEEIVSVMVGPERFRVMPLMDVILPYCDVAAAVRLDCLHEGNVTLNCLIGESVKKYEKFWTYGMLSVSFAIFCFDVFVSGCEEDDSDTEEEAKEEEAIDKKELAPPVSNQVEATT